MRPWSSPELDSSPSNDHTRPAGPRILELPSGRPLAAVVHPADTAFAGMKILVVDDDSRSVLALSALLKRAGLDVISAEGGEEALALLEQTPDVDLVLVDMMMPGMDGYATMRAMRELPSRGATPLIAVTARVGPGERQRCIDAGASGYISKPVDTSQFRHNLGTWLRGAAPLAQQAVDVPDKPAAAILVVDDNAVKRLALRAMLAPLGHAIIEVDSGSAALRALSQQTFALILMDVRMPIMDGFETAKLCRQQSRGEPTPIIFITAMGGDETEMASAYASGAVDFVFTPVLPDVLRAKATAFVDLFVKSQELRRSLKSITALNATLRDGDIRMQAVLDNVSDGIFIVDGGGLVESANRSADQLFGYEPGELAGHLFAFMVAPELRDEFCDLDTMRTPRRSAQGKPGGVIETLGCRRDGSTFAMELEHGEMTHGEQMFTLVSVRDISERKAQTKALEHLALHDGLTGLANRTLFGDLLSRTLAAAKRTNEPRAVLVLDLNGFKRVNDTLGHDRGDTLLTQVSQRLVATLREGDAVARLGGDEFGILPADATDLSAAVAVALKVQQACEPGFVMNDETVHVSPSIGIALFPEHGTTTADLLHRADLAMYAAKRSGNGHAVFHAGHETTADDLSPLVDLRHCVTREQLVLDYQPKIDLATGSISGVEALVRWQHPTQGLLAPASFIGEVERTHLIAPVTRWVLNAALHQQRIWRDEGLDLTMAVNVSASSLRESSTLPDTVAELTQLWDTAPGRLTLELTEGALIEDAAPHVLERLHDMGQRISIDDFGTGYSSLAYLQRLPVDEIKVDKSFVMNLAAVNDDAIIVRSTIDLAHNLGLTIVAEGVEDENVANMLVEYECDAAQGYHFGRPTTAENLTELLNV
jgi:diguanylate cyclase (GGDEF)-like protein/PAS domain S-box-containing protein